jgi:hypothetical protein
MTVVESLFPEALSLDTGDYAGAIHLQSVTMEPVYRSVEQQVENTIVYSDLPSEDVVQLPEYEEFTVTSDEDREATTTRTFKRVAVSWNITAFDDVGLPSLYEAEVIFRGTQRLLTVDYYLATAQYSGAVPARIQSATIPAFYEREPIFVPEARTIPTIQPLSLPETRTPLAAAVVNPIPFVIAGSVAVVMLFGLLFLLYFFLYKNARLVRIDSPGQRKVLSRKHLRNEKGEVIFKIDPAINVYRNDARHSIVLNRQLAAGRGSLTVIWGDKLVLRAALGPQIDISKELIQVLEEEIGGSSTIRVDNRFNLIGGQYQ